MSLKLTKIQVHKYEKDQLRAFVNLTFEGELTIDGFKLMDGENGMWLASPSIKKKDSWSNVVRLTKELHNDLIDQVMDEYDKTDDSRSGDQKASDYHSSSSRRRR